MHREPPTTIAGLKRASPSSYSAADGFGADGGSSSQRKPIAIDGIDDAKAITLGASHACVLRKNGRVSCWGSNDYGELGTGKLQEGTIRSGLALRGPTFIPFTTVVDVVDLEGVTAVAAGYSDTCAVLESGETRCWGEVSKDENQLAVPYESYAQFRADPVPTPFTIPGLPNASYAAIGKVHGCALTNDQTVWCWGQHNRVGQAMFGQTYSKPAAVPKPSH